MTPRINDFLEREKRYPLDFTPTQTKRRENFDVVAVTTAAATAAAMVMGVATAAMVTTMVMVAATAMVIGPLRQ